MFTYFKSAVGAWLLHVSTSTFLYGNGRVLGCSSILYNGLCNPTQFNTPVLVGMAVGTFIIKFFAPQYLPDYAAVQALAPFGKYTTLIAGLLTGLGTKWGSGCTSGHMLCGLARFSLRSLVATCTFSLTAILTSALFGTAPSCGAQPCHTLVHPATSEIFGLLTVGALAFGISYVMRYRKGEVESKSQTVTSFYSGVVFALGLLISGLASPAKTLGFLALLPPKFDPSLLMVVLFGILPNAIEILKKGYKLDPHASVASFNLPTRTEIPLKFVAGAAIFGVGWGLSGTCPGPGVISAFLNGWSGLLWLSGFLTAYHLAPN